MSAGDAWLEEDRVEGAVDRDLLGWLLAYARPEWRALAGCVVLLLLLAGMELAQPFLIKEAIDTVIQPAVGAAARDFEAAGAGVPAEGAAGDDQAGAPAAPIGAQPSWASAAVARASAALSRLGQRMGLRPDPNAGVLPGLWPLVVLYALTVFGAAAVQYAQMLWLRVTGQRIITRVRADVFDHVQTLSLAYFDRNPTGRIVTRVTNDVETLNEMYTSVLVNLFRDVFFIAGTAFVLWSLDVRLALTTYAALPLVVITAAVFRHYSRSAWSAMRARLAHINATLSERLSGMRLIQIFNREQAAADEFKTINDGFFNAAMRLIRVFAIFGPLLDLLTAGTIVLIVWIGGRQVLAGVLTLGTLYAVTAYVRGLFEPINALAEKYNILQSALASAERIGQLMATRPDVLDPEQPVALPPPLRVGADASEADRPPAVSFEEVWFAYDPGEWVLRGVSFDVRAGETVAFVGHTGAGKSTIMSLLPRFYDVQRGAVRVHGIDVRSVSQADLRKRVGVVMQDVFLFSGDVAFNIDLGAPALTRADVMRAAGMVGADIFVRRLPGRYEEPVVERGLSLSSGQRQLISFARALAYDPEILVLDEATASVDSETEAALQRAIMALARDRTTLIVAHRLSTIQAADRIYVLDAGQIVEQGRHAELLALDGRYRALWQLQFRSLGRPHAAPAGPRREM